MQLSSYWRGEKPLGKSFWLAYVLGSLLLLALALIAAGITGLVSGISIYSASLLVFLVLWQFNPCYVFGWVAVWRASRHCNNSIAVTSARFVVIFHMVVTGYFLIGVPGYLAAAESIG